MPKDKAYDAEAAGGLTVIGEDAVLEGILRSTAPLQISGAFKGKIIAENEFIISPEGRVAANVKARRAVIAGVFQGDMVVLEELEIASTGRFIGKLIQKEPVLRISRGGRFEAQSVFVDDLEAVIAPWGVTPPPPRQDTGPKRHIALDEIKL
jgi:cytoskeletal protein CcmA (bactofilin family)